ncbi:MAG: DUF5615 family PIN-like protein [Verrucomicrobiae bacterium]|nr:DUF5615 family PIN-like protein [Verrucomicrobiae bacterium]
MKGILLDENIPKQITFTPTLPVFHSTDLGASLSDTVIWQHAKHHQLVIVSKDTDFSNRMIFSFPPPWVVHLRFNNMRKKEFHSLLARLWPHIEALLPDHKLINVFADKIEAIKD